MKRKYFQIAVHYSSDRNERIKEYFESNGKLPNKNFGNISGHIVRAISRKNALEIANKHSIGNPFNSKYVVGRTGRILDMRYNFNKQLLSRRKNGIGGSIWYEDKDGKLQKEL